MTAQARASVFESYAKDASVTVTDFPSLRILYLLYRPIGSFRNSYMVTIT